MSSGRLQKISSFICLTFSSNAACSSLDVVTEEKIEAAKASEGFTVDTRRDDIIS